MTTTEKRAVVVRARRPGGYWSAGRFFAQTTEEIEVDRTQFEELVADRDKGFLEITGEGLEDIAPPAAMVVDLRGSAEVESALEELKDQILELGGQLVAEREAHAATAKELGAAQEKLADIEPKLAAIVTEHNDLKAKQAEMLVEFARAAEKEGEPVKAPTAEPTDPKKKKG